MSPDAVGIRPVGDRGRPSRSAPSHDATRSTRLPRLLGLAGSVSAILFIFFAFVRPWYLQWGATTDEAGMVLPGDGIVAGAHTQATRAITIDAGIARVWPWVAQLGQDRGGFYSYDILENLVGCRMPASDFLRPDRQFTAVGDTLWMYPRDRAGGFGHAVLRVHEPGRALAFGTHSPGAVEDGSWAFVIVAAGDATTRLIVRSRGVGARSLLGRAFEHAVFEPVHFAMERRTMIGIRQLAEGGDRHRIVNHFQVLLWIVTLLLTAVALVLTLVRRNWERPLAAFTCGLVVFQLLTLGQPSLTIGIAATAAIAVMLIPPAPAAHQREDPA